MTTPLTPRDYIAIELTNNFTDSNGEQMPLDTALHISYILSSLKEREKQHD